MSDQEQEIQGKVTFDLTKNRVALGCGIVTPETVLGTIQDSLLDGVSIKMVMSYQRDLHRYRPDSVTVERKGDVELNNLLMQRLRIRKYFSIMLEGSFATAEVSSTGELSITRTMALPKDMLKSLKAEGGDSPTTLLWVGRIYRFAEAVHSRPAQEVAKLFGISPATAGRWISAARKTVPDWYGDELQKKLDKTVNNGIRSMSIEEAREWGKSTEPYAFGK